MSPRTTEDLFPWEEPAEEQRNTREAEQMSALAPSPAPVAEPPAGRTEREGRRDERASIDRTDGGDADDDVPRDRNAVPREYYSISEVCDIVGLKPHVLRYWETQFGPLNPSKNRSGNRVYQKKEVRLILLVKHLLYEEKYTVEGARSRLDHLRRTGRMGDSTTRELGDVSVVAPDREQSATSHSLTLHYPLRVRHADQDMLVVDGTPTDCVILAIGELLPERPDFVLSGVNHGANLGDDVLYSGTVAAAMEATILGIPAVAVSYTGKDPEAVGAWMPSLTRLLERLLVRADFPAETLLNVNLPAVAPQDAAGVRVTTLGRRAYVGSLTRAADPGGREYFWIGGGEGKWWGSENSDFRAVHDRFISITPLHLDLTNHGLLAEIGQWDLTL
jgi:5'-nucleotidase